MKGHDRVDCVVVGYNDVDFSGFAERQKEMISYSGAYQEVKTNSILLDGHRITYMDVLNRALNQVTGKPHRLSGFEATNLGVACLASVLRKKGFRTEIVNFFNNEMDRFEEILAGRPRSVAITTTYYTDSVPIQGVIQFVRERSPDTQIIVGGPHIYNVCTDFDEPTQDLALDTMGADLYIFDSQGEMTLALLVDQLRANGSEDPSRVPNLIYRNSRGFARTPRVLERNPPEEMGVDWQQFDPSFFTPTAYMRTARSCPFTCAFCNYPAMAGKHEMMGVEAIERELRMLHEAGCRNVIFIDDTFNVPLPRFKEICRMMIRNKFNFKWISFFRCSNSDDEAFDLMAESGCLGVLLGIESGDQKILDIMNKAVKIEKYLHGVKKLKDRGIITYTLFFFGHPGETAETAQHSIDFVRETEPDFYLAQLYFHDAKVPIHRRAEEFGIQGGGYNWKHKTMDWREASQWVENMYRTIDKSTILPLYGIGLWTLPYLLGKGITESEFRDFTGVAHKMLVKSLADVPVDFCAEEEQLRSIFQARAS